MKLFPKLKKLDKIYKCDTCSLLQINRTNLVHASDSEPSHVTELLLIFSILLLTSSVLEEDEPTLLEVARV